MSKTNQVSNSPETPIEVSQDELNLAKSGKSRDVHERKLVQPEPVQLTETDLSQAKIGKSADIMEKPASEKGNTIKTR